MKTEIEWVHIEDGFPVIPKGRYGISVLVVKYDSMCGPNGTWEVGHSLYASTTDRNGKTNKWFVGIDKAFDFMDLYYGPGSDMDWGPTGDPVVYWAYMPTLPETLDFPKAWKEQNNS